MKLVGRAAVLGVCLFSGAVFGLTPGATFNVQFPEMPATYWAMESSKKEPAQMSITLPKNYAAAARFPLIIFLQGGSGGNGGRPAIVSAMTGDQDFIYATMPLFKKVAPKDPGGSIIMQAEDARYMWPFFRAMLAKLFEVVPNVDKGHMVLGGFSNGAHGTQGLIDESDGEVAKQFSAFFFIEGGGRLKDYELLKGKAFLMVSSQTGSKRRAQEIAGQATAAGALTTFLFEDAGGHTIPTKAAPAMRAWLIGPAMDTRLGPAQ